MPSPFNHIDTISQRRLQQLGQQLRAIRKERRISAVSAALAAGMSRITWHRIERGEPSVSVGAYFNALTALGLDLAVADANANAPVSPAPGPGPGWIPARIPLADYPQLNSLAWQVHGTESLSPVEAFAIYERNARHLDDAALQDRERDLMAALRQAFGDGVAGV